VETNEPVQNAPQSNWVTGDGKFGELDTAPESVKNVVEAKKWESIADMATGYKELESKLGSSFRLPDKLEGDVLNEVYTKLGKPSSADGYNYTAPEGVELDEALLSNFKQYAYEKNMPNQLFQDVVDFQIEANTEATKLLEERRLNELKEAETALKNDLGDNYDSVMKGNKEVAENLEILDLLEDLGIADHPKTNRMLKRIKDKTSEDTLSPQTRVASQSVDDELEELKKSDALLKPLHPDHKKAHLRFVELCAKKGQAS
jgi:hypothetical protein